MKGLMQKFVVAAALAGLWSGFAVAAEPDAPQAGTTFIVEDTTRDILTSLHSRLDAFRKVQLPVAAAPTAETVTSVVAPEAYGSLVAAENQVVTLPECGYDSRFLNRFWGGGLGTWQSAGRRNEYSGYKYTGQGVMLGYDRAVGPAVFGGALSYVKGKYENKDYTDHDSDIAQYSGHLYATYNTSRGFFFTLAGGYTFADNDLHESDNAAGETAWGKYNAHTFNGGLRVGFDFEPTSSLVITPSIGGNAFYTKIQDHDGNNTNDGRYDYRDVSHTQVEIPLDVTVAKEFFFGDNRMLQVSVNGGYAYNLNDKSVSGEAANGRGAYSRIEGRRLGHNAWKGGTGVRLKMDQWDIGVKYDYLGRNDFNSHRVTGTVGFSF